MASALASPPPPWSFGSSDLKRSARAFLERALVISAILHLLAVGAFRAAYQRMIPKEEVVVLPPTWTHPVDLGPHLIPWTPRVSAPPSSGEGQIVPVDKVEFKGPEVTPYDAGTAGPGTEPISGGNEGSTTGERTLPPPEERGPGFPGVAEVPPEPTFAPRPTYPEFALEAQIEGKVIVRVLVGVDGLPKQVVAISGPKVLLKAAEDGVKRWKFRPGMTSGQPVEVWVEIPVVFRLGS